MRTPILLVLDQGEELSKQVQRVTASLRPRPDMIWCDSFDAVEQLTADTGPFDVIIAGPLVSKEAALPQLRTLRARTPGTQLILAVDRWRTTSLRDTVRTGALDILRLPATDEDLLEAVVQALEIGPAVAPARTDGPTPGGRPDGRGTVITVVSGTGGCGKTFLATNLAYYLQAATPTGPSRRACLVDLDLQFGELSTALRLRPRNTIHDLLAYDGDDDDLASRLVQHLELHDSGIRLLSAPLEPEEADSIDAADVARVIDAARAQFDYVIIDTPAALSEPVLVALEQSDRVLAMATLDLPSVRNLGVMLATLKRLKVPPERITLLLNKVETDVGIEVARVEQYFPQGFSVVIPYGREVNRSLNMGQPLLAYAPRGEVSKVLSSGLDRIMVVDGGAKDETEAPPRRRRPGWRGRKSA